MHGIYRVEQAGYVIRIRVAASQECVNTYATRRVRCVSQEVLNLNLLARE